MIVLLDTCAWIEYFKGTEIGAKTQKLIEGPDRIIISTIVVAEFYRFSLANYTADEAEQQLSFLLERSFGVNVSTPIATAAAAIQNAKKLGLADSIILATAHEQDAHLVTCDNNFRGEPNVTVLD
jgi:predicted nucleic acid-binding protein